MSHARHLHLKLQMSYNGIDSGYHIIRPWGGNASIRTVEYTQLAQCCMMTISLFLTEFSSRGSVFTTTLCSMYAC